MTIILAPGRYGLPALERCNSDVLGQFRPTRPDALEPPGANSLRSDAMAWNDLDEQEKDDLLDDFIACSCAAVLALVLLIAFIMS